MNQVHSPATYLSIGDGKYRVIHQGLPICKDQDTLPQALAAAKQFRLTVADVAWNGTRGEWVTTATIS